MIKLEHVSKAYSAGIPALNDVSLHIKEGEFVFVVGESGSGKSTFIRLLLKELEPTSGKIFINGQEINRLKRKQIPKLRRNIGVVFQDFRLFAFTIKENVTVFEDKNVDLEEIYKIAGIEEWIDSLEDKDETHIYKMFVENGIEPDRIIMEDKSVNTYENLENSCRILEEIGIGKNIAIVTDGFHQYRAGFIAKKLGYEPSAINAVTDFYNLTLTPTYYVREWMAVTNEYLKELK